MGRSDLQRLEKSADFYSSLIGIGHSQIFQGQTEKARNSFQSVLEHFTDYEQQRTALVGLASTELVVGDQDAALKRLQECKALAEGADDQMAISSDMRIISDFMLEQGRVDEAEAMNQLSLDTAERADVSAYVKASLRRRHIYRVARVALARGDLDLARAKTVEYAEKAAMFEDPREIRRQHELEGEIYLAAEDPLAALASLAQADPNDPRVLLLQALANRDAGNLDTSRIQAERVVNFNEPTYGYALYRARAEALLVELREA